jgi:sugar/nucleoside kinase (ribokinase family)
MKKTIVCFGDLVADMVMQIPQLPIVADRAQLAHGLRVEPGGVGNTLITAARLGGRCVALGAMGEDPNGQAVFDILRGEGVDLNLAQRGAGSTNTLVLVFVDAAGQHVFIAHDGEGEPFALAEREANSIRDAGVFFIPGYALAEGRMAGAALAAIQIAQRAAVPIMNDLGPVCGDANVREAAMQVIRHSTVTFLTADEAMLFTGKRSYDVAARALQKLGSPVVIIKRGGQGCAVFEGDGMVDIPGIGVVARDTTAAGDTFAGGFMVDWLKHGDAIRAAKFANVVAAAKVQKIGSGRQCPTQQEVQAVLALVNER